MMGGAVRGTGGPELTAHLRSTELNDEMRPGQTRGVLADGFDAAMAELTEMGRETGLRSPLRHAWASPPPGSPPWSNETWDRYWQTYERVMGLGDCAFVEAIHGKPGPHGRPEHRHRVYLAVTTRGTHVRLGHDFARQEAVSRLLEHELGLPMVRGAHNRRAARFLAEMGRDDVVRAMTDAGLLDGPRGIARLRPAELAQQRRTGLDRTVVENAVLAAWRAADGGAALAAALAERGLALALGDRGRPVVVDPAGGIHGLARTLAASARARGEEPVRARAVSERLGPLRPPSVAAERAAAREETEERRRRLEAHRDGEDTNDGQVAEAAPSEAVAGTRPAPDGLGNAGRPAPDRRRGPGSGDDAPDARSAWPDGARGGDAADAGDHRGGGRLRPDPVGTVGERRGRAPGGHDEAPREHRREPGADRTAARRARARDERDLRALTLAARRHHVRLDELRRALDAGARPAPALDLAAARQRLKELRRDHARRAWRAARGRLEDRIAQHAAILRLTGGRQLEWQFHRAWAAGERRALRRSWRWPDDGDLLRHLVRTADPEACAVRLALAVRCLGAELAAARNERAALGDGPPYPAGALSDAAIRSDLQAAAAARVARAAEEARRACGEGPALSLWRPWTWRRPTAAALARRAAAAEAALRDAESRQRIVRDTLAVLAAAEVVRRREANVRWACDVRRVAERAALAAAAWRLSQEGDREVLEALLEGGPARAVEVLRDRQAEAARKAAEDERRKRAEREAERLAARAACAPAAPARTAEAAPMPAMRGGWG